jgi:hypothetical protein
MLRTALVAAAAAALAAAAGNSTSPAYRGVNLGGWLVLESWIVPSLFANNGVADGLGEWEFCQQLGPAAAQAALQSHWSSWVQPADIQALAAANVTHVYVGRRGTVASWGGGAQTGWGGGWVHCDSPLKALGSASPRLRCVGMHTAGAASTRLCAPP